MRQDSSKRKETHTRIGPVGLSNENVEANGFVSNCREGVAEAVLVLSVNLGLVVEGTRGSLGSIVNQALVGVGDLLKNKNIKVNWALMQLYDNVVMQPRKRALFSLKQKKG